LQRYARTFRCAEINSSFYRPHKVATYAKWAAATPGDFRFSVKVPKQITHELKLHRSRAPFEKFLSEVTGLGDRLGPLLVQLPPSLTFDARSAAAFFRMARERHDGPMVLEPRHVTWFTPQARALLARHAIGRVAADPPTTNESNTPVVASGVAYFRLHGTPRMYWSRYEADFLEVLAKQIGQLHRSADAWCIFDNTASGAALENAWELQELLS